jgi:hypothetical protein
MSWIVGATDVTPKVGELVDKMFEGYQCVDPEEGIRQAARKIIADTVAAQTEGTKLQISAFGSQSTDYTTKKVTVSLSISITPTS